MAWGAEPLTQNHTAQSLTPPEFTLKSPSRKSTPWAQAADSSGGLSLAGGATGSWEGGASAFLQASALCRKVLDPRKSASVDCVVEGLSTGTMVAVPSAFSHRNHTAQSVLKGLQSILIHPLSADVQGEWVQMRFCVLAL